MAPLPFASLSDLYSYNNNSNNNGNNNVNNNENLKQNTNQITQESFARNNNFVQNNRNYQEFVQHNQTSEQANFKEKLNPISSPNLGQGKEIPPNVPNSPENLSKFAQRPAWSNIMNRFQTPYEYLSEHDQLVSILQEISFILKVIMILLILMFVSKICKKK